MTVAKIQPTHCDRLAYVYVRQSTPWQVLENRESTERQYQLQARAIALGWSPHGEYGRPPHRISTLGVRGGPGPRGDRIDARGLAPGPQQ
jgi:hypothetical protein